MYLLYTAVVVVGVCWYYVVCLSRCLLCVVVVFCYSLAYCFLGAIPVMVIVVAIVALIIIRQYLLSSLRIAIVICFIQPDM